MNFEMKQVGAYLVPQIDVKKSWGKAERVRCNGINGDLLEVAHTWENPTPADYLKAYRDSEGKSYYE